MAKHIVMILFLPLVALVPTGPTVAQTKKHMPPDYHLEHELLELERQMSEALAKQDVSVLNRLWSDTLVFTSPNGQISNKAKRLAAQKPSSDPNQLTNRNEDVKVDLYGNTAVVTVKSRWEGKTATGQFSDSYQATHVWVKQHGRWQLVAAHVSQVRN